MEKLVSIITPSYNGAKYLPHFFEGILNQTYKNIELIFVDDGSTDDTKSIVNDYEKKFDKNEIKFIYIYQINQGQAAAVNTGLKKFSGDYLMWVDSDDFLLPENISEKVKFLEENGDYGFVQCLAEVVDAHKECKIIRQCGRKKPVGSDNLFQDLILENNVLFCPGIIMCRSENLRKAIPSLQIYESREGQNWQLMLPLAYTSKCGYIEKVLFQIVAHDDSHSRIKRNIYDWLCRYEEFCKLLNETILRIEQMPENEKHFWYEVIRKKYLKKKYFLMIQHINELKKEMKESGVKLSLIEKIKISSFIRSLRNRV